ncbi:MAG: TerC family protein [Bacteroidetes bacterium]|nr:TerC family protein [Bacteroidota bacterium]
MTIIWIGFIVLILIFLAIDLIIFNRRPHEITIKESLGWSLFWILLALVFNVGVYFWYGHDSALQFFTGYLIEKSLSVDNLFVFLMIFSYFKVPSKYQHKVLFWGILGALIFRGLMIALGAALIANFHWILYVFGVFLIITGIKMGIEKENREVHPERNIFVRIFKRLFPVTAGYHEEKFFIKINKKRYATLLFIVLIVVESTDIVFAIDSIPAIFAITHDPFIVFTSNVFAILGLRSLYFALAGIMEIFYYLRHGLSVILTFVGIKMVVIDVFPIPITVSLAVVASILSISIIASIIRNKRKKQLEIKSSS